MSTTRLMRLDDAPVIAGLLRANREFLAPWEPVRDDVYFTEEGQVAVVAAALAEHSTGVLVPHVILSGTGDEVGRITLNNVVRAAAFQSCSVGYWVSSADNGRGLATAAVREMTRVAFEDEGLHRVEAGTLVHNVRSQRVLERNGFVRFGLAPEYLKIAGTWQDHVLYQLVNRSG